VPAGNPRRESIGLIVGWTCRQGWAGTVRTDEREKKVSMTTTYDFEATTADGARIPLADYEGKLLLIVNVASKCGLTPQYEGLEALYRDDKDRGLEVLGFPCNQFKEQEPASDAEIQAFCKATYDVTFPVFAKIDVNGPGADPLYTYLRAEAPGDFGPQYGDFYQAISKIRPEAEGTDEVKWNFTKFLVDRQGSVVKRYEPSVSPADIETDLERYL
jgi:glutathione peroxidase